MILKTKRFFRVCDVILLVISLKLRGKTNEINNVVFDRLQDLGGLYIKFLQILALKPSSIVSFENQHLSVFDQVPYEELNIGDSVLSLLPKSVVKNLHFETDKPFAAGSFAQVYAATYNGVPVVVKVLRPSVQKYLKFDQKMIRLLSYFISGTSKYKDYAIREVVKQFIETTSSEVMYKSEVRKANELYERFKLHSTIVVPRTFTEACTSTVIIQERLFGVPFTTLLESKTEFCKSNQFKNLLIELGYETLMSTLNGQKIHADPHPGNLMLLDNGNKIGLIDFGISGEAPINRLGFFEVVKSYDQYYRGKFDFDAFFDAIFGFYAPDLHKSISTFDLLYKTTHMKRMKRHAKELFDSRRYDADVLFYLKEARIRELFISVINKNNAFGLNVTLDGGVMQMGANAYQMLLERFEIKFDVVPTVYSRVVKDIELKGLQGLADSHTLSTEQMAQTFESWFSAIAEKNPLLFTQITKYAKGVN